MTKIKAAMILFFLIVGSSLFLSLSGVLLSGYARILNFIILIFLFFSLVISISHKVVFGSFFKVFDVGIIRPCLFYCWQPFIVFTIYLMLYLGGKEQSDSYFIQRIASEFFLFPSSLLLSLSSLSHYFKDFLNLVAYNGFLLSLLNSFLLLSSLIDIQKTSSVFFIYDITNTPINYLETKRKIESSTTYQKRKQHYNYFLIINALVFLFSNVLWSVFIYSFFFVFAYLCFSFMYNFTQCWKIYSEIENYKPKKKEKQKLKIKLFKTA